MDNAISILSGGLDSAVSTAEARENNNVVLAVTFDYGQKAARQEIKSASNLCKKWKIEHKVIELKFLSEIGESSLISKSHKLPHITIKDIELNTSEYAESMKQVWVPNRNGIFINIVAGIAEANNFKWIITGFNKEEAVSFPDNSPRYINLINSCLSESTLAKPQVVSFVKEMDKTEILKKAIEHKIAIEDLWCCYDGDKKWCGECESCVRFKRAMKNMNILDKYKGSFKVT